MSNIKINYAEKKTEAKYGSTKVLQLQFSGSFTKEV